LSNSSRVNVPDIRTELPGPEARRVIEVDERHTSPSYTRVYPLVAQRGEGAMLEDVDGNRFLDFNAGIAVCSTGHCHPRVVEAIQTQAAKLLHMSGTDFYYRPQAELAQKLAEIAPGDAAKKVFLSNSGAEAVEAALKLARYHTGRKHVIAFYNAFHGRTMGALSLTASKPVQRRRFAPFLPEVTHVAFPDPYRRPTDGSPEEHAEDCFAEIEHVFRCKVPADEVAAVVVEPIQGEGGYVIPPVNFLPALRRLTDEHGILLVADEVQSGMGRTGKLFAVEHAGIVPDLICLAKGIASGMPLGALIAGADMMTWPSGSHASTFGGNPVCCAAALETVALLEEELMDNAARIGDYLVAKLAELQQRHALIGDVRGRGLMIGVELVTDRKTKEPAVEQRNAVIEACFQRGLLILGCGASTLRLSPPLVISESHADVAVEILDAALEEAGAG